MKITQIETYPIRVPLKPQRRMISALGEHVESRYVLVRMQTNDGLEGVGEATVTPRWSGETVWGAQAVIDKLFAPLLLGQDPREIHGNIQLMDAVCQHNWFAKSALEMACWDLAGKSFNKPVYDLLGGAKHPLSFRCRYSMGAYDPERARTLAQELIRSGFTTIKIKVGGKLEQDVERVRVVREVIGPEREIYVDANCGWDAETAIEAARQMQPYHVALFEQPSPDGDYSAMARVRESIEPLVMADDICFNLVHAQELIRNECCDVISVYPGKNGGIHKAREIVEYAALNRIPCSIGSNLELDVGTAAMGHLVIGCRNLMVERFPGDVLGPEYHEFSIAKNPISIHGPVVTFTERPGLGVDVDWDVVKANLCGEIGRTE